MTEWTEAERLIVVWRRANLGTYPMGTAYREMADLGDKLLAEREPQLLTAEDCRVIWHNTPSDQEETFQDAYTREVLLIAQERTAAVLDKRLAEAVGVPDTYRDRARRIVADTLKAAS